MAVIMGCIWLGMDRPEGSRWYHFVLWFLAGAVPIGANLLHGDRLCDSGLRIDNIASSAVGVGAAMAVMAACIVAVSLAIGGAHVAPWPRMASWGAEHVAGAIVQQYLLQAFMLRRLRQAGLTPRSAVVAAALLFAAVHAPNWFLVLMVAVSSIVWCSLFLRRPNLFTLAVSHGALAALVYYALPVSWHLRMTIGMRALRLAAEYAK